MLSLFCLIGRHATRLLAVGIFIGLVFPDAAAYTRPLLPWFVAGLMFLPMLRIDVGDLAQHARNPISVILGGMLVALVCPLVALGTVSALPIPTGLGVAIVMMCCAPALTSTPAMALILGLNASYGVIVTIGTSALVPLTAPILVFELLGIPLEIDAVAFILRLAVIVLGSLLAAAFVRRLIPRATILRHSELLDGLVVILMLGFAIGIMDGVTEAALAEPLKVATFVAAGFLANGLLQLFGTACHATALLGFGLRDREKMFRSALVTGMMCGNRNMGLLLAALPADTPRDVFLYFALAQFPLYMLPSVQRALFPRIIGAKSNKSPI